MAQAKEIEEHIIAYEWSIGKRTIPNIIAIGYSIKIGDFSGQKVFEATVSTDIKVQDVNNSSNNILNYLQSQAILFDYKNGIRDIYIGTERDPWANER